MRDLSMGFMRPCAHEALPNVLNGKGAVLRCRGEGSLYELVPQCEELGVGACTRQSEKR